MSITNDMVSCKLTKINMVLICKYLLPYQSKHVFWVHVPTAYVLVDIRKLIFNKIYEKQLVDPSQISAFLFTG